MSAFGRSFRSVAEEPFTGRRNALNKNGHFVNELFQALTTVQNVAFGLLGILAVAHWRRRPGPAAGWLAATLGSLATVVAVGSFLPDELNDPSLLWTGKVLLTILAMFPYFLFRFMSTFVRQPRWLNNSAAVLTGTVVVASLSLPGFPAVNEALPPVFVGFLVLFVTDWLLLSSVVAVRLWQGGKGQPGVARRRMRTLSLGTAGLALALLVSSLSPSGQQATPAAFVVQFIALATAPLFLLGFAPPRLVRLAWRRREELALRAAELELMQALDPQRIADILLPSMCALVGGEGAELRDVTGGVVGSHVSPGARPAGTPRGVTAGGEPSQGTALTVPLRSGEIVVYASPFTPFFGSEEAQILQSLGVLADLALARAGLFQAEQRKNAYLRVLQQVTSSANAPGGSHQAIQSALDTVCSETPWKSGHAYMVAGDSSRFEASRSWRLEASTPTQDAGLPLSQVTMVAAEDAVGRVFATGQPAWIADLAGESSGGLAGGAGSTAVVPIQVASEVVGVLQFLADRPQELDQELLDVLSQIGVQLGRSVERARSQDELRRRAEDLSRS
ncbi:MAG TPA: GAF domain-containing protein, partial [Actinomycetota bacterium]|nr:GAF domain-containing protein [Actinomycetota bacterium]